MSININKAQSEALSEGFDFNASTTRDDNPVTLSVLEKILVQYGSEFASDLAASMKQKQVFASGRLADNIIPEIVDDGKTLQIRMLNYYDYPNKGVKGVKSSKNAPSSPYQYKNFGMSNDGRASIKEYIESGRAKIRSVKRDAARGIGLERKGVSAIDAKVNTLIYLIKAYGIKRTNYFDESFKRVFKDFAVVASQAVGKDIVITIDRINKEKPTA